MSNPVAIDRAHGGGTFAQGVLDFSISVNPLGPPAAAQAAYEAAWSRAIAYPPAKSAVLEEQLATWLRVPAGNVMAGNGTTQLIYLLARVLEPARAFVAIPTFSEIANALAGEGLPPEPIQLGPQNGFHLDLQQIDDALASHAGAIFLGRPNSPTGTLLSIAEVETIAVRCASRGCWCVIDEAFIDFVEPPDSAVRLVTENPRVIVLRSLTKSFAIPGLRLGCVAAPLEVTSALRDAIEPWSVNVAAESVGLACLEHAEEYLERTRRLIAAERAYLSESLGKVAGVSVYPSAANFLMLEISGESAPGEFAREMIEQGVAVRDLSTLPGCDAGQYRIGIRNHTDNERMVQASIDVRGSRG
jgi:threonine-phosphate decarboxylase